MKQLAGYSGRQRGSFYSRPVAPEWQAAKATASACSAGSVSLDLEPTIQLAPYRPPEQTQARLDFRHPEPWEPASKPRPLTAGLPRNCRKPLVAEQHSSDKWPHFPCCQPGWRSPPPAWSIPAPCQDDRYTPQCRMPTPIPSVRNRAGPQTTVAVPPSPRSPPPE